MLESHLGRAYGTIKETAQLTGLSDDTLRRAMARGEFRAVKVGARTLVDLRSIDAFFSLNEVRPRLRTAA